MSRRDPRPGPPQPGTPWPGGPPQPDGGWPRPTGRTPLVVVALWLLAPGLISLLGLAGGALLVGWAG